MAVWPNALWPFGQTGLAINLVLSLWAVWPSRFGDCVGFKAFGPFGQIGLVIILV